MFGRRRNSASHTMAEYYPYIHYGERGINQNNWRQLQQFNYSSPIGGAGFYNSLYTQHPSYGSEMKFHNAYPNISAQGHPFYQYLPNGYFMKNEGMPMQQSNISQSIFQNPLEPETNQNMASSYHPYFSNSYMNPYPKQSFIPKQPSSAQAIMNSFKGQDGSIDVNKMMNTAGQMINAVSQVSSLVKGLGGIIKV